MNKAATVIGICLSFVVLVHGGVLQAQNVEFKGGNFKDDKEGLKTALEHIKLGDEKLELGNQAVVDVNDPGDHFQVAVFHYRKAQQFNGQNGELNYKLGNALLYTNEKYEARAFLERALKLDPGLDPMIYYYLAQACQLDMEFDKALAYFDQFTAEAKSKRAEELKKFLTKYGKECKSGPEIAKFPVRCWVDNLEALNSPEDDYSPCISADGEVLMFTSRRKNDHPPDASGHYDGDIYFSQYRAGKWSSPGNAGTPLSTPADETASALSYDGQRMLMFSYKDGNANVMQSELKGLNWSEPQLKMSSVVNSEANESFASYEPSDIKVFYIYDGKINGDRDIFFSGVMDRSKNTWGKGQSVGSQVNTAFHEGSVYIHPDGYTMYFSSQGHNSMGGYDIFKAELVQGIWTNPVNMGYPINTPYDDLFFAGTANGKHAFIASNRAGGKGGLDLYKVTFWGQEKPVRFDAEDHLLASQAMPMKSPSIEKEVRVENKSLTVFKGVVVDYLTKKPLGADIDITDNVKNEVISTVHSNSASGKFLLSLPSGRNYGIAVRKEGYLFHSENFNLPELSEYNMVNKEVALKNIRVGSKIALRNVFFETAKADVKAESYAELNRLVDLMNQVPALKIELSGHTDNVGSESLNVKLSQERAEAVRQYLKGKGIADGRLVAKGYGSSRPVDSNDTAEGRQGNRRTEYEIIAN